MKFKPLLLILSLIVLTNIVLISAQGNNCNYEPIKSVSTITQHQIDIYTNLYPEYAVNYNNPFYCKILFFSNNFNEGYN